MASSPDRICEAFQLEPGSIHFFAWICRQCSLCYSNDAQLEDQLGTDTHSGDRMTAERSQLLLSVLETLKTDGLIFTKDIMKHYKTILTELDVPHRQHNQLSNTFRKYLNNLSKKHFYKVFIPTAGIDTYGRALYDERKFNPHTITYIFKLKQENWSKRKSHFSIEHLQNLIRQQISLFPTSKTFDYTCLISEENMMELDNFFIPELFTLIDSITTSRNSTKHSSSALYKELRTARIRMVIAILCLTMNPQCCFLQTITGLLCYAYGLRDKGFEALNALGCYCSIDHIRSHGTYWAGRRQPIQNLDSKQPWRITIDNLNFHMKYAKNLPESATGANKMLNLLTCQTKSAPAPLTLYKKKPTLKQLVFKALCDSINPHETSQERSSVRVEDFDNHDNTPKAFTFSIY